MNKHTPGPWYFDEDDRAVGPVSNRQIGVCSIMLADGDAARYHFGEQSIANANLISSAPDLLEALEEIMGSYDPYEPVCKENADLARAAIAKAKGIQP